MSDSGREKVNPLSSVVREYFDALWNDGDPWDLEISDYDQEKYSREMALLAPRRFERVLELGCAGGAFTRRLAGIADHIVAIDVAARAIERALAAGTEGGRIEYRVGDVMAFDPVDEKQWDLVVLSETIYYLGWRYSFFDVGWMAQRLFESVRDGGCLLMTNTTAMPRQYLQQESLLKTYRDLFINVGFTLDRTERYQGTKGGAPLEALLCLFVKRG
jgi:predicted TPR repeat methyltransferase